MMKKYLCEEFDPEWCDAWCDMIGGVVNNINGVFATLVNVSFQYPKGYDVCVISLHFDSVFMVEIEGIETPSGPTVNAVMWAGMMDKLTEI